MEKYPLTQQLLTNVGKNIEDEKNEVRTANWTMLILVSVLTNLIGNSLEICSRKEKLTYYLMYSWSQARLASIEML